VWIASGKKKETPPQETRSASFFSHAMHVPPRRPPAAESAPVALDKLSQAHRLQAGTIDVTISQVVTA
jgi:hypothetical protein